MINDSGSEDDNDDYNHDDEFNHFKHLLCFIQ